MWRKWKGMPFWLPFFASDLDIDIFLNCVKPWMCEAFIFKVRKQPSDSGGNVRSVAKRRKHSQRSDVVGTAEFAQQVQDIVNNDSSNSMWIIALQLEVAESTIGLVVHEDLGYQSYVMRRGQFMSQKNLGKPCHLVSALAEQAQAPWETRRAVVFFWWEELWPRPKLPSSVLAVVSNEGRVMLPHFFQQGLRTNSKAPDRVVKYCHCGYYGQHQWAPLDHGLQPVLKPHWLSRCRWRWFYRRKLENTTNCVQIYFFFWLNPPLYFRIPCTPCMHAYTYAKGMLLTIGKDFLCFVHCITGSL